MPSFRVVILHSLEHVMKNNPVAWFEIPVFDMARAVKFYQAVFGIEMQPTKMDEYHMAFFPMEMNVYGAGGALIKGEGYAPAKTGTVVYFHANDIDATLARVEASGGSTIFPRKSIGQYGHIAWFEDCEGNAVALHTPPAM
jgi:uncharacterized protein